MRHKPVECYAFVIVTAACLREFRTENREEAGVLEHVRPLAKARRPLLLQVLAVAACFLSIPAAPALAYDWLQFGWNPQHSGNNTAESILTQANVSTLVQQYQVTLPAIADGAPVYLAGVTTPGGVKNLLFVTTRNALIIALDAQTGVDGLEPSIQSSRMPDQRIGWSPATPRRRRLSTRTANTSTAMGSTAMVHKLQVGDGTEITTGGWPQRATFKGYRRKGFFGACDRDVGRHELTCTPCTPAIRAIKATIKDT